MASHDIIDNRTESLAEHIGQLLANSQRAKFALGYFFLSGFESIADRLQEIEELHLLIGNTSTRETIEQLVEGYNRLDMVEQLTEKEQYVTPAQQKAIAKDTARHIRRDIEMMDQTDGAERLLPTLARLIQEKKVKVRVYTKGRLHAKAYIFDYPPTHDQRGVAIVGSSNLTLAGVRHNTELNVKVYGDNNHQAVTEWFESLWAEAQEFDEFLLHELKQSWAMNIVRPYDVYIKTLYNLVKSQLEGPSPAEILTAAEMPELAEFQWKAVEQALRILNKYDGVFVSDVVGMGKSFVGSAILKHFRTWKRMKPLIICPASLQEMWEGYNEEFDLGARVLSMSMLHDRGVKPARDSLYKERKLVLIDESHNFRHPDTQRYKNLQPFLHLPGTKVVLLTATPRNKLARDILNQIRLFHPEDTTDIPIYPSSLTRYFKAIEAGDKDLRDLLRHVLIRRTRKHILDWYGEDDENGRRYILIGGKRQYFPKRELATEGYSIEETYQRFYHTLRNLISRTGEKQPDELWYARYGIWHFVKKEKQEVDPYRRLQRAGRNLRGLMRIILFKRLESSVEAFRLTLGRIILTHRRFLKSLEMGIVPAGDKAEDLLYETRQEEEEQLYDQLMELTQTYEIGDFEVEELKEAIRHDLDILDRMRSLVENIRPQQDAKLQALKKLMEREGLWTKKVLIFSQFAETARYLYDEVNPGGQNASIEVIDSAEKNRSSIIRRFAPVASKYAMKPNETPINTLVATDVLSEGLNLQDCDTIINYDLHWNPVRLIQRIGRIDRIGTQFDKVYTFNFLPELELERQLRLRERLHCRIQEIHDTIGEDAEILDKTERLNPEAMYAIYEGDEEELDRHADEDDMFGTLEAEEIIRQLERDEPNYMRYIRELSEGVRTARTSLGGKGAIIFCQAGSYPQLYWTNERGEIISRDLSEILRQLKCEPDEEAKLIPRFLNATVSKVRREFEREAKARLADRATPTPTDTQRYVLREVQIAFREAEDEDKRERLRIVERIFRSTSLTTAVRKELHILRRQKVRGDDLVQALTRVIKDHELFGLLDGEKKAKDEEVAAQVICSEALV